MLIMAIYLFIYLANIQKAIYLERKSLQVNGHKIKQRQKELIDLEARKEIEFGHDTILALSKKHLTTNFTTAEQVQSNISNL